MMKTKTYTEKVGEANEHGFVKNEFGVFLNPNKVEYFKKDKIEFVCTWVQHNDKYYWAYSLGTHGSGCGSGVSVDERYEADDYESMMSMFSDFCMKFAERAQKDGHCATSDREKSILLDFIKNEKVKKVQLTLF